MSRLKPATTTSGTYVRGAEMLGLKGEVERKDFVALINNRWPGANGEPAERILLPELRNPLARPIEERNCNTEFWLLN